MAQFRGWSPLIAVQIEYSLMVESELVPMAMALGLGVTPWSPLRGGVLSGKYTRENAGQMRADRGERVTAYLNERTYAILDELSRVSTELETSPAAVALAWVQSRPGVASTIIGARRLEQLDRNLASLELALSADQIARLNRVSEPAVVFPTALVKNANSIMHAGAMVNGEGSQLLPLWKDAAATRF
jgi:aryl-alcohol dehydrogenase-like predicted oxidoreductase